MPEINSKQIATLESLIVALQELVSSLRGQGVAISGEVAAKIEKFKRESLCLLCELPLGKKRVVSGCHPACAQKVRRKIDAGKFTLQHAVSKGWINPISEPSGPKPKRPDPTRDATLIDEITPETGETLEDTLARKKRGKKERSR